MKKRCSPAVFFFVFLLAPAFSNAQQTDDDRQAVIAAIQTLFDGMRASDSVMVRSAFYPDARLCTTFTDKEGNPQVRESPVSRFITQVGTKYEFILDERIWSYEVRIDGNLASVWTEYTFFRGDQMSHCGVNAFQMVRTADGWKILNITDTRSTTDCRTE
ncbi:MAG TPA: nuclear transport factor 2 family protein [Flavilitoribacter sp.]|nr:nuclear transport factor 2 family protein [Flavilitoribacter sp.]